MLWHIWWIHVNTWIFHQEFIVVIWKYLYTITATRTQWILPFFVTFRYQRIHFFLQFIPSPTSHFHIFIVFVCLLFSLFIYFLRKIKKTLIFIVVKLSGFVQTHKNSQYCVYSSVCGLGAHETYHPNQIQTNVKSSGIWHFANVVRYAINIERIESNGNNNNIKKIIALPSQQLLLHLSDEGFLDCALPNNTTTVCVHQKTVKVALHNNRNERAG